MLPKITVEYDGNLVTLLDIPSSIEYAQETRFRLRSDAPPTEPYPSTEPKGVNLQKALNAIEPAQLRSDQAKTIELESALLALTQLIQPYGSLPWCFTRLQRTAGEEEPTLHSHDDCYDDGLQDNVPIVLSPITNRFRLLVELHNKVVINPSAVHTQLEVTTGRRYLVPPRSKFLLSSINRGFGPFEKVAPSTLFDAIVMDPPWSNRSIRRARNYKTVEDQAGDPFWEAVRIVGTHLKRRGLAAVWVTNKAVVRTQVLDAMKRLGLELRAEVTWLKVTTMGVPVTAVSGIWRKPYESLIIFSSSATTIQSQVIVAVPDTHSRKPCLKTILEPHLPTEYAALELFARSMTAGWMSWGDEVLKFQDTREWNI